MDYRPHSENPFHSWWYNAAAVTEPVLRLFGLGLALRRCSWTKSHARLTIVWLGW